MDKVATELLKPGMVGVIPTDTVYGLAARASDVQAVTRLYELKRREHKPGTLVAASIDQLVQLGIKARYLKAVESFWPNSISIIIPCGPELDYLSQEKRSLAVRIPKDSALLTLLEQTGPLITSSANQPGEPAALTVDEAKNYFGDSVDFYEDGGDLSGRKPSTIIRMVDDAVEVIRQGAVEINEETGEITTNDI